MLLSQRVFFILLISIFLVGLQVIFPSVVQANDTITLTYTYNQDNTVTVKATSSIGFKETKPTWSLNKNKLTYTKIYNVNESYYTTFVLSNGSSKQVKINITQIDDLGPTIEVKYDYDNINDIVTVTMVSNEIMANTKPTWVLSEDKLTYTKKYYKNESYYTDVKDIYGNVTKVKLNIDKIKGPQITMEYIFNEETNTVIAKIKSNKILGQTKPTWILSEDKLTYTKEYTVNESYTTVVEDTYGNSVNVKISITQIKDLVLNGIDVSMYQGTIDWSKVKKDGVDFCMIRAGYRGYGTNGTLVEDAMFAKNILGATSNGIDVGIYFYTQAITVDEAIEEANFVLNLIKKYGVKITYPVTIDTELSPPGTGRADNLSKENRTQIVKAFCDTIKNAEYTPMIYANKYWLNENLNMSKLSSYDVWLAHYTNQTDYKGTYTIWQYTDKGTIQGISGDVDKNYCYKKYN